MKKSILFLIVLFLGSTALLGAQNITGKWRTIDDNTGQAKSIVEISLKDGVYYGKVIQILNPERKNITCDKCTGSNKGKKVEGLTIISGLTKKGAEYTGGKILDPESGKEYKCSIKANGSNKLDVRGYVGISLMGRTQTWERF